MGIAAAITVGVAAVGSTAYSIDQGNKARADAKAQANKLQADQDALAQQAKDKLAQEKAERDQVISSSIAKSKGITDQSNTRNFDTLGNPNPPGAGKTLLGS